MYLLRALEGDPFFRNLSGGLAAGPRASLQMPVEQ